VGSPNAPFPRSGRDARLAASDRGDGVGLGGVLLARYGTKRRLRGYEASRVAFNVDKLGEVRPIHGPATGVEVRMSFTISDLRRARQAGDQLVFWGVPVAFTAWFGAFGIGALAGQIWTQADILLLMSVPCAVLTLLIWFMQWWAAVHTKLE
jgi:hypothetical protein